MNSCMTVASPLHATEMECRFQNCIAYKHFSNVFGNALLIVWNSDMLTRIFTKFLILHLKKLFRVTRACFLENMM
mgnify:CR=1 FL=1